MKISYFETAQYFPPRPLTTEWPVPPGLGEPDAGERAFAGTMRRLRLIEKLGFDWVSLSEHHYSPRTLTPNPTTMAAYIAGKLERLTVAVLGPIVPHTNPIRVAEELAMVDNLAPGRLVVGLLRGTMYEYLAYDLTPHEARDRTNEGMELILKAWTEPQPFGWQGRYFQFRTISVWPRPRHQPHPPTYVLGTSKETCDFAARHRLGLGVSFAPYDVVCRSADYYREQCARYGWEPGPDHLIYRANILMADSEDQARRILADAKGDVPLAVLNPRIREALIKAENANRAGPVVTPNVGGTLATTFFGDPDSIVDQVKRVRAELGAGVLDLNFRNYAAHGEEPLTEALGLFGEKVLPRVRDL